MNIVTIALPYANGPLHCGHILEAIIADIHVRYLKEMQQQVIFLSGQDAHGAAIMISAKENGESEESYISKMHHLHMETYKKADVEFDRFSSTHSETNKNITKEVYLSLMADDCIREIDVYLPLDPSTGLFLADRFLSGTCPKCQAGNQYGDNCESCGATYQAHELIDPRVRSSGINVAWESKSHSMVILENKRKTIKKYLEVVKCVDAVKHKLLEWFSSTLKDWDITRDSPYFGFEIPGKEHQYFYVWLDAPCGYIAALQEALQEDLSTTKKVWNSSKITHVIGKDIIYFHGLFWPAMLSSYKLKLADELRCHGFVTMNGQKMSKSKGQNISANDLCETVGSDCIRYYFASKSNEGITDIDISCDDFLDKIHAELIGKCINLGSRLSKFVQQGDNCLLEPIDEAWLSDIRESLIPVIEEYKNWNYANVTKILMRACDAANLWIEQHKPWHVVKNDPQKASEIASTALQVYRWVLIALKPICPNLCDRGLSIFAHKGDMSEQFSILEKSRIQAFEPLLSRFEKEKIMSVFGG